MKIVILKVFELSPLFKIKCESKRILTTFIFTLLIYFPQLSMCQKQNNIWCFGDSAGINFSDTSNITTFTSALDTRGSCVSIADSNGQLLFYAHTRATLPGYTSQVWNRLNQIMDGGDSIIGRGWYNELIIVPFPGSTSIYYLFSAGVTSYLGLYYSIIDMNENGGLGKVIQKNTSIHYYETWDGIAAVKHANGRDWWLISKDNRSGLPNGSNTFTKYLITNSGITESVQNIGSFIYGNEGTMTFSKTGSKFLFTSWSGLIEVLDFDRCSGQFSIPVIVSNARLNGDMLTIGSAFSANENVIYVSQNDTTSYLFQYDLTASNIGASKDTISIVHSPRVAAGVLRLAPNDKIYWSCVWNNDVTYNYPYSDTMYHTENMNLSVINSPDVLGVGCDFSLYGFYLGGKRTYWGLPNNPDYTLGEVSGSICDSLTNSVSERLNFDFEMYPNPTTDKFYIKLNEEVQADFKMFDYLGRNVMSGKLSRNSELDLVNFKPGIYYFELRILNKFFHRRIVKVDK